MIIFAISEGVCLPIYVMLRSFFCLKISHFDCSQSCGGYEHASHSMMINDTVKIIKKRLIVVCDPKRNKNQSFTMAVCQLTVVFLVSIFVSLCSISTNIKISQTCIVAFSLSPTSLRPLLLQPCFIHTRSFLSSPVLSLILPCANLYKCGQSLRQIN